VNPHRKKEYAEWIAIRDRTHKRIWTKISHPRSNKEILSGKEQKEEREYLEAFAEEHKLRAEKEALEVQVREMEGEVGFFLSGGERHSRLLLIGRVIVDKEFDTDREGTYTSSERIDASIRDGLWWTHARYVRASHLAFLSTVAEEWG
jgi:hypothetical protein